MPYLFIYCISFAHPNKIQLHHKPYLVGENVVRYKQMDDKFKKIVPLSNYLKYS